MDSWKNVTQTNFPRTTVAKTFVTRLHAYRDQMSLHAKFGYIWDIANSNKLFLTPNFLFTYLGKPSN